MKITTVTRGEYRKSSYSSSSTGCVAIGPHDTPGIAGIQDTKEGPDSKTRTTLVVPAGALIQFLGYVRTDQLAE